MTNNRPKWLDFFMQQKSLGEEKKRIWFADQYCNAHEETLAVDTVLDWFRRNSIEYINSIPKIKMGDSFTPSDQPFKPHDPGARWIICSASLAGYSQKEEKGDSFSPWVKK